MRQAETLSAIEVWMEAGLGQTDWSIPLTWSLKPLAAKAVVLARRPAVDGLEFLGASLGTPTEFLNLCREFASALHAPGPQERVVAGLGKLAWCSHNREHTNITLIVLFDGEARPDALASLAAAAATCVAARARQFVDTCVSGMKSLALSHLPLGFVVVDRNGHCVEANPSAHAVFARGDGLCLREEQIACRNGVERRALQDAIDQALDLGVSALVRVTRHGGWPPYVLRVIGQKPGAANAGCCILLIVDPDTPPAAAPDVWRAMFGLTECELMVAHMLVSGGSVGELARQRGVTVETIRQQKKSVLARLDVASQVTAAAILSRAALFYDAAANDSAAEASRPVEALLGK